MPNSEVASVVVIAGGAAVLAFLEDGRVFHGTLRGRGGAIEWNEVEQSVPGTDASNPPEAGHR